MINLFNNKMGATSPQEKIERKMLELKYKRVEIQEEKEERLEQLKKLLGREIIRNPIPDYIDDSDNKTNIKKKETRSNPVKTKKKVLKKNNNNNKKKNGSANAYERKLKNNANKKKHHYEETKQ